jgi:chromosome segregation ATPase
MKAVKEFKAAEATIAGELAAWRERRDRVAGDLETTRGRLVKVRERQTTAVAVLEPNETDMAAIRREAEIERVRVEELEVALEAADRKIQELTTATEQAERRVRVAVALQQLDRLAEIAGRADAGWAPMLKTLEELVLTQREAGATLERVLPGRDYSVPASRLLRALIWRLSGLVDVGFVDASERVTLRDFFRYEQDRAALEAELAGKGRDG